MKLNLGCGKDTRHGWVNIDHKPGPGVDMVLDISQRLPFGDGSVDEIYASHVLEHILHWEEAVKEFHRVLRPGGLCELRVPYRFSSAAPYHYRFFEPDAIKIFVLNSGFEDGNSLDVEPLFWLIETRVDRQNLCEWHMKRYLGRAFKIPIGRRWQIVWRLEKVVRHDR